MGGPKLATFGDGFPVGTNQPLGDVEAAAIALRKTEHHGDLVVPRRVGDFLGERTIVAQGIVEVALDEALRDRPRRRSHPDVPGIARNPGFREGNQFRALFCGFLDVSDVLATVPSRSIQTCAGCTTAALYFA